MNLREKLNKITTEAKELSYQEKVKAKIEANEKLKYEREKARLDAQSIIRKIEDKAEATAKTGKNNFDLVKTNIKYSYAHGRDYIFTQENNLGETLYKGIFDEGISIRDFYIIDHIVNELGLTAKLEYRHDGVGMESWYVIVVEW